MGQVITLVQGDADTLTETITGLSSLGGYSAKMYIKDSAGTALDTLSGTVSGLTVTYEILNESSKLYAIGEYDFETKLFDASDHVYTPSKGKFIVLTAMEEDPS